MMRRALAMVCAVLLVACGREGPAGAGERTLTIAAAASVKPAMGELIAAYSAEHKEVTVTATYGASGNLCGQILNGAPFDMLYSADTKYPAELVKAGRAAEGSQRVYARGTLVLWALKSAGLDVAARGAAALKDGLVKHIAIANPRLAPYGRAAEEALKSLGLEGESAGRLVTGENVEQAAQFAQMGGAQAALIPRSLALQPAMVSAGEHWIVPVEAHAPIEHGVVIVASRAELVEEARAFDAFVAGPRGREILSRHGFGRE